MRAPVVAHSEFNRESEETTLYQIWIEPNQRGVKPAWKAHEFPKEPTSDKLSLLVAGDGTAPLHIYQDAEIYAGTLKQGAVIDHPIKRQAYLLVSAGEIQIEDQVLAKGDGYGDEQAQERANQSIKPQQLKWW